MIRALLFDFSRVLLHPKNSSYKGALNDLHKQLSIDPNYRIFDHFQLNDELLEYLKRFSMKFNFYILTTDVIQDDPDIRKIIEPFFKRIYSANKLGLSKKDPEIYKYILKDLRLRADEVLFIDDTINNIAVAKEVGLKTINFISNQDLFSKLDKLKKINE